MVAKNIEVLRIRQNIGFLPQRSELRFKNLTSTPTLRNKQHVSALICRTISSNARSQNRLRFNSSHFNDG